MLLLCLALLALATTSGGVAAAPQPACAAVVVDPAASALAQLAGRELRRYIWHVTATLAPIYRAVSDVPPGCRRLVLAEAPEQLGGVAADADAAARVAALQPSEHLILSQRGDPLTVVIAGGDGQGALYAAYLFAHEVLGVHFSLAGDVLPAPARAAAAQNNNASSWGSIDLLDTPRFPLRGLQPFYNFAEGPDWWSEDHWRSVLAQAAKMRMNMVAIHTYSPSRSIGTTNYSSTGPVRGQPQLWVGTPGNVTADGNVTAEGAYGADWASTAVGSFSIQDGRGTSGYPWGGALAFANDCHANPEVFEGSRCNDDTRYAANDDDAAAYVPVFAAAAAQLRGAFRHGKRLGFKFALGNEVPVLVPGGGGPSNFTARVDVYKGIYTWLNRTGLAPLLDYFWMWTTETWPARRTSDLPPGSPPLTVESDWVQEPLQDFRAANAAREEMHMPFRLATGGWTLGPLLNASGRALGGSNLWDQLLPLETFALGSIDEGLGDVPVEKAYGELSAGRESWQISWMEHDSSMTQPQVWVDRTLEHLADAERYGVHAALGIHWRVAAVAMNFHALAYGGWKNSSNSSSVAMLADFFSGELGDRVLGEQAAAVLTTVDGCGTFANEAQCPLMQQKMPMPVFKCCPGPFMPIDDVQFMNPELARDLCDLSGPRWAFVEGFAALGSQPALIQSPQHHARFEYWNHSFAYWRSIAALECQWQRYENASAAVRNITTAAGRRTAAKATLLALRITLVELAAVTMTHQLQLLSDPGDLGVLTNIVSESILAAQIPGGYPAVPNGPSGMLLGRHTDELSAWLGQGGENATLPPEAMPQPDYRGKSRVYVPTIRTLVEPGERIRIRATVLTAASIDDDVTVTLRQRPMGETSQAAQTNLTMVQVTAGRGVFEADLGALTEDWEWMIDVLLEFDEDHHHRGGDGAAQADGEDESQGARQQQQLFVPPGAPAQWQSIVVMPS